MLLGFMGLCLLAGASAASVTLKNVPGWYHQLIPPPLTPPDWLFAPAWSCLYIMMAVAAWLVWRQPGSTRRAQAALTLWGGQIALNVSWPPVFFGLHWLAMSLAVSAALLAAVTLTTVKFWPVNRMASILFLPYIAWVGFATYLNAGFWWLNH